MAAIAMLLWLVLHRREPAPNVSQASQPSSKASKAVLPQQPQAPSADARQDRLGVLEQALSNGNVPITFFGRVIDQDGAPVPGAIVSYRIIRSGKLLTSGEVADDSAKRQTSSATDGNFTITGDRGVTLSIEGVQKEGYRESAKARHTFAYFGSPEIFSQDKATPQIFLLVRNEALQSLLHYSRQLGVAWDGQTRAYNLEDGQPAANGELRITTRKGVPPDALGHFDWKVEIAVNGGGVQEVTSETGLVAP